MIYLNNVSSCLLILVILESMLEGSVAWIPPSIRSTGSHPRFPSTQLFVQTVSLKDLTDHEKEGTLLAESIARWLDHEWMPQEVHVKMGESAKASYIAMREAGKDDLMDIMMEISTTLDKNWQDYDKDAFVNAWDIGNYASDYLVQRSGNEACECSSEIF
ncbi:hypothetical protein IV203_037259 [Nitzschia inconspicua]|uniref:Uncharacterized protein n=1 Tax=Nitzschia inconspicua TaxID=303405 RepID=A0A9K3LL12_9STRA|nr:hypothetical protein IV203_037259 [Nitzschia inconspicua]